MKPLRVVVVGAGISGLACAHRLGRRAGETGMPLELVVVEAQDRPGGHVHTVRERGFQVESGPNAFLDRSPEPVALLRELELGGALVEARPAAARRFILRGGRLRRVPDGLLSLLRTDALSPLGKARLLLEPWAKGPPRDHEETVDEFACRRVGAEAAAVLVDAAVAGISAGDSRILSLPAAFPVMERMEREHGSLVSALFAGRRAGTRPARLLSLTGGMGMAVEAIARQLGPALRTASPVRGIELAGSGWRVHAADGIAHDADRVVLALPGLAGARLFADLDREVAQTLAGTPFASVAVVALGVSATALPRVLDGYGYLVPRGEGQVTLGVVHESALFDGRAPAGAALLRIILGGPRDPAIAARSDAELVLLARRELARVVGDVGEPLGVWTFRWPHAIAQYVRGHRERTARARARLERHPGLYLCGTSYDGISFGSAVAAGRALADRLLAEAA